MIDKLPPAAVTVTFAVAVVEPVALVAVSVYVVVAVGLTLVEPLAEAEVNVPGVMAMPVAPLVAQFNVLLEPDVMLAGLAVNELMAGLAAALTVTVTVDVTEPAVLVAVSVYVVVVDGATLVEPLADEDVNVPGVMATVVDPVVTQLRALPAPALTVVGFAVKEVMDGGEPPPVDELDRDAPPQPASTPHAHKGTIAAHSLNPEGSLPGPEILLRDGLTEAKVPYFMGPVAPF